MKKLTRSNSGPTSRHHAHGNPRHLNPYAQQHHHHHYNNNHQSITTCLRKKCRPVFTFVVFGLVTVQLVMLLLSTHLVVRRDGNDKQHTAPTGVHVHVNGNGNGNGQESKVRRMAAAAAATKVASEQTLQRQRAALHKNPYEDGTMLRNTQDHNHARDDDDGASPRNPSSHTHTHSHGHGNSNSNSHHDLDDDDAIANAHAAHAILAANLENQQEEVNQDDDDHLDVDDDEVDDDHVLANLEQKLNLDQDTPSHPKSNTNKHKSHTKSKSKIQDKAQSNAILDQNPDTLKSNLNNNNNNKNDDDDDDDDGQEDDDDDHVMQDLDSNMEMANGQMVLLKPDSEKQVKHGDALSSPKVADILGVVAAAAGATGEQSGSEKTSGDRAKEAQIEQKEKEVIAEHLKMEEEDNQDSEDDKEDEDEDNTNTNTESQHSILLKSIKDHNTSPIQEKANTKPKHDSSLSLHEDEDEDEHGPPEEGEEQVHVVAAEVNQALDAASLGLGGGDEDEDEDEEKEKDDGEKKLGGSQKEEGEKKGVSKGESKGMVVVTKKEEETKVDVVKMKQPVKGDNTTTNDSSQIKVNVNVNVNVESSSEEAAKKVSDKQTKEASSTQEKSSPEEAKTKAQPGGAEQVQPPIAPQQDKTSQNDTNPKTDQNPPSNTNTTSKSSPTTPLNRTTTYTTVPSHPLIPNTLTFTHSINLLTTPQDQLLAHDPENLVLAANVRNTIALHPNATVRFLTDEDCIQEIIMAMTGSSSGKHYDAHTPLVEYFEKEVKGMYKADICRGAALYNTGGLYFDVDLQARLNVFDVIPAKVGNKHNNKEEEEEEEGEEVEFVVPVVHRKSKNPGAFFQAFIAVTPRHPIMKRYLDLFVEYYTGKRQVSGALGVLLLRQAYDDMPPTMRKRAVLWQEVHYHPQVFPDVEPTVGERRACHFVVAVPNTRIVPFYSRVRGSRMCGGKHSHLKGNEEITA